MPSRWPSDGVDYYGWPRYSTDPRSMRLAQMLSQTGTHERLSTETFKKSIHPLADIRTKVKVSKQRILVKNRYDIQFRKP